MVETPNRKHEPVKIINQQGENDVYQNEGKQRFYTDGIDDRRCDHWYPGCGRSPVLLKVYSESASDQRGFPRNSRDPNQPGDLLQLSAAAPYNSGNV